MTSSLHRFFVLSSKNEMLRSSCSWKDISMRGHASGKNETFSKAWKGRASAILLSKGCCAESANSGFSRTVASRMALISGLILKRVLSSNSSLLFGRHCVKSTTKAWIAAFVRM